MGLSMPEIKKKSEPDQRLLDQNRLKEAFILEQNNENVIRILRYLEKDCGFTKADTVVSAATGGVDMASTTVNAAIRSVYVRLRRFMPKELVSKVENE